MSLTQDYLQTMASTVQEMEAEGRIRAEIERGRNIVGDVSRLSFPQKYNLIDSLGIKAPYKDAGAIYYALDSLRNLNEPPIAPAMSSLEYLEHYRPDLNAIKTLSDAHVYCEAATQNVRQSIPIPLINVAGFFSP